MVFSTDAVEPAAHEKAKARTTLNLIFSSRVLMVSRRLPSGSAWVWPAEEQQHSTHAKTGARWPLSL